MNFGAWPGSKDLLIEMRNRDHSARSFYYFARRVVWEIAINWVAAAVTCPKWLRVRMYRTFGLNVHRSANLSPAIYFQTSRVSIGPNSFVNRDVRFYSGKATITIGANVHVAMGSTLLCETHDVATNSRVRAGRSRALPIEIGDGCWIGANVTVLPNVSIGEGSVVAAGAVVTKSAPANTFLAGIPAKKIRDLENSAIGN